LESGLGLLSLVLTWTPQSSGTSAPTNTKHMLTMMLLKLLTQLSKINLDFGEKDSASTLLPRLMDLWIWCLSLYTTLTTLTRDASLVSSWTASLSCLFFQSSTSCFQWLLFVPLWNTPTAASNSLDQ
jgi:hypothetical protein